MAKSKGLEEYLEELKTIADKMSEEDIRLEDAVGLYKQGSDIADRAEKLLGKYEKELEIVGDEEHGSS